MRGDVRHLNPVDIVVALDHFIKQTHVHHPFAKSRVVTLLHRVLPVTPQNEAVSYQLNLKTSRPSMKPSYANPVLEAMCLVTS